MHIVIILIVIFLALYLLFESGIIALQSKRALLFTASINGMKAKFGSCTGKITRIVRFRDSAPKKITYSRTLEKGDVHFKIFDCHKNVVLSSDNKDIYFFTPDAGKKYTFAVFLEKASGQYKIDIEPVA